MRRLTAVTILIGLALPLMTWAHTTGRRVLESPGVEPAIAAAGLMIAHGGFMLVYFEAPPAVSSLLIMFAVGILLALGGGWVGEALQGRLRKG